MIPFSFVIVLLRHYEAIKYLCQKIYYKKGIIFYGMGKVYPYCLAIARDESRTTVLPCSAFFSVLFGHSALPRRRGCVREGCGW